MSQKCYRHFRFGKCILPKENETIDLSRSIYAYFTTNEHIHENNYFHFVKYRTCMIMRLQEISNYVLSREIPQPTKAVKAPHSAPKRLLLQVETVQLTIEGL